MALGSNMGSSAGNPGQTLAAALVALGRTQLQLRRVSRFFSTPCFPPGAGPDYVNAAATLSGALNPADVLKILHDVEASFGRERTERWGMRSLDLDLIAAGPAICPDLVTFESWRHLDPAQQRRRAPDRMILPHPRLQDRAFVLVPLADIAADWRHPVLNSTVVQMCAALAPEARQEVVPLQQ
ncbi:2-amino-4-hydroxy-6-hydroxymethyldihydropteridine diphosphokinase [Thalassococcus sp. BH17M4-6]|uniref:2-amino-4-hydroxy-6- hydroxymethyldihydropteridine diphosphokinase n=1 Tax=Thalassococcus sp. BH17M4-6 TaxID=3413148 RepID=UPI003BCDE66C